MSTVRCSCCGEIVEPRAPRTAWKLLNLFFWVGSLAVSTLFAVLLGLDVLLLPVAVAISFSIGTSARAAYGWSCPVCHDSLPAPPEAATAERPRRRFAWRHA
ncbi:MAG: hypothetical protein KF819_33895 [Labilithrix sp.]|nr:hypothetical protein [Labilithrix sp.]